MHCLHASTMSFPGATLESSLSIIQEFELKLKKLKCILLLMGTNDLTSKFIWLWYKHQVRKGKPVYKLPRHSRTPAHRINQDYRNLINRIKLINPNVKIVVSAILPRVFDYKQNKNYLKNINKSLATMCKKISNCYFIESYKPLLKNGAPRNEFYKYDGLHLTLSGIVVLKRFFMSMIYNIMRT